MSRELQFFDLNEDINNQAEQYAQPVSGIQNDINGIENQNTEAIPRGGHDYESVYLEGNMENNFVGLGSYEADAPLVSEEQNKLISSMRHLENRRVLLVNTVAGTGSVGRLVTGLYDALTDAGYECLIAYGRKESVIDGYNAYRIGSDFEVYLHGAISRTNDKHGYYSKRATQRFIEVIEDFDPDIIHLHNVHGYYLNIEILFKYLKESGRRIIWTLHDCWTFTGHCSHFEYIGCNKWQTGCHSCEQLTEYPKSFGADNSRENYALKKELFTGIDNLTLVTPSQWLKDRVAQSFLREYHTVVVPTGIDLTQFRPMEEEVSDSNLIFNLRNSMNLRGKYMLLGVANPWRERKGLLQFETLAKTISDKFTIVLLGVNDSQLNELPESIIGLARTDSVAELAALYSMADIYVNLTLEDTFPTTNLEALACGTPVVTYKAGGAAESIDDSCGIAVERNSIQGVIAAFDKILSSKGINYTVDNCLRRAKQYDKNYRFHEYIQEVYNGF